MMCSSRRKHAVNVRLKKKSRVMIKLNSNKGDTNKPHISPLHGEQMCLIQEVQHKAMVLPGLGGHVRTVEDYFKLILGAQKPLATLAAPQKPFNSLGWMLGSLSVEAATTQLHQGPWQKLSHDLLDTPPDSSLTSNYHNKSRCRIFPFIIHPALLFLDPTALAVSELCDHSCSAAPPAGRYKPPKAVATVT